MSKGHRTQTEIITSGQSWNILRNKILNYKPNPLQNKTQFIKNVVTQLFLENNCFIEQIFDKLLLIVTPPSGQLT